MTRNIIGDPLYEQSICYKYIQFKAQKLVNSPTGYLSENLYRNGCLLRPYLRDLKSGYISNPLNTMAFELAMYNSIKRRYLGVSKMLLTPAYTLYSEYFTSESTHSILINSVGHSQVQKYVAFLINRF